LCHCYGRTLFETNGGRYHLPVWHRGMEPNSLKEKFNRVHSSICNVVERSFALWKNKWQILYKMPKYSMLTQKKIVAATMVLHNYIHEHSSGDVDFANCDRDPHFVPTISDPRELPPLRWGYRGRAIQRTTATTAILGPRAPSGA
jgi:hypothetical protein